MILKEKNSNGSYLVGPEGGESYWQPVPANGFVRCLFNSDFLSSAVKFSAGTQTVDPGCYVREHMHESHEELIYIYEGTGCVVLDGAETDLAPGAALYIAPKSTHKFINTGTTPLSFFWILLPGGLDDFFRQIGRERKFGDIQPAPFPRPENIADIEAKTVFGWTRKE